MLYNILKDQWQTIEIDRIRSITQKTEFSQMAKLLYALHGSCDRYRFCYQYNRLKDRRCHNQSFQSTAFCSVGRLLYYHKSLCRQSTRVQQLTRMLTSTCNINTGQLCFTVC